MKLSIIDRIVIIKSLLPESGTIDKLKLIISLKNKVGFTNEELDAFQIFEPYKGMLELPNVTPEMYNRDVEYDITLQEIELLKELANGLNLNGWVTISSLDTIEYILNYMLEE